jgi:Mrp family chromosome partitioning ATPase
MERIQSALAKARAARDRKLQVTNPSTGKPVAETGPWSALTEMKLLPAHLEQSRIVAMHSGPYAAGFDVMRTNLLRSLRTNGWTRVAITSPTPGCGKSTVAANLAFSLSRLADTRVLVIELDLRHPSLGQMLGVATGPNFAAALAEGRIDYSHMRRAGPNLAFALNSRPMENPAELLSAARTADIIDEIEAQLRPDVVLFDLSPMLVSDDAMSFLDQVDCALVVAAAEETTVAEIDKCGKDLAKRTQVLGVVLNKCRYMEQEESLTYPE